MNNRLNERKEIMAFVYENPASDWVKNRYDWTSIPLLYQGEAGSYCRVPLDATVDKERDIIFYQAGGGMGRTSQIYQPITYLLLWKGTPIKCETSKHSVRDPVSKEILKKTLKVNALYIPKQLINQKSEIFDSFSQIALALRPSYDLSGQSILPCEFDKTNPTKVEVV